MRLLGDLLDGFGPAHGEPAEILPDADLVQVLGAGLPAGHLHVWGGPPGCGKTAFLLSLLSGAALRGRRVLYATYDLPAATLALRLVAMHAGVDAERVVKLAARCGRADENLTARCGRADEGADPEACERARRVASRLRGLLFWLLEARGLGVASLEDRLVRMPFRADVLAVDYLQAVVREPETDVGQAMRDLAALASHLHLSVVCALRSTPSDAPLPTLSVDVDGLAGAAAEPADRVGWIAPAHGSGLRRAEVLRNRYGDRPALPLRLDPRTGLLVRDVGGPS